MTGLLRDAKSASGAKTDTDAVRLGLEALVRRCGLRASPAVSAARSLAARETRRRRERASSAKHSAA